MIKAIIVEDEWYTLDDIKNMVEATGFIEVCGTYQNPISAISDFDMLLPRVAFIDIEMPDMDGITLAKILLEKNPSIYIVFITAYNQYAVDAFDLNALDYIKKPISAERFIKMSNKLKKNLLENECIQNELTIKCFGDFEVKIAGKPVKWERAKAEELFAFLLINHKRKVHKDEIIEELWYDYDPSKALAILQTSVCKIRSIFASIPGIVTVEYSNSRYSLIINKCQCDLFDLEFEIDNFLNHKDDRLNDLIKVFESIQKGLMKSSGFIWAHSKEQELYSKVNNLIKKSSSRILKSGNRELAMQYAKLSKAQGFINAD